MSIPVNPYFKPGTRELLPATRDAYLQGTLATAEVQAIKKILKTDSVERGVTLARYHELAAEGRPLAPPPWIREQLQRQPSVSAWGPLRRPVVQGGLLLLLVLGIFSAVQWVRNQPLVPIPVQLAFKRTVNSAAQGLGQAVVYTPANLAATKRLTSPPRPVAARAAWVAKPAPARPAKSAGPNTQAPLLAAEVVPEAPAPAADSVAGVASLAAPAPAPEAHLIRGHVYDDKGRPLAGATVLVKGTQQATVTNASGSYELAAPPQCVLEVGYAGYTDETMSTGQSLVIDVTLQPLSRRERRQLKGY